MQRTALISMGPRNHIKVLPTLSSSHHSSWFTLLGELGLPPTSTPNMSCYYVCCSPSYRTVRTTRRYCRPCYTSCCSPCYTSCYRSCCSPRYISCCSPCYTSYCSPCYTSYCSPCSYRRCYTRYYYPSYCTYSSGCCYC
ncbi:keratin-associated protein 4-3 [Gallus gallus]|uniref:keratin-associated protein 4-3 n=1 Tax=Gallus gallus TaxID=9031 RepID=UPI001AEAD189|nr:keratin-associated protein 4-3 [Gallus gallus]